MAERNPDGSYEGEVQLPSDRDMRGPREREDRGEFDSGGRPQFQVNWDQVDRLLVIQCTKEEVAWAIGCHPETLLEACKRDHGQNFRQYSAKGLALGRISLRRAMYKNAMAGDTRMQVHLSKQYLGHTERTEVKAGVISTDRPTSIDIETLSEEAMKEILAAADKHDQEGEDDAGDTGT